MRLLDLIKQFGQASYNCGFFNQQSGELTKKYEIEKQKYFNEIVSQLEPQVSQENGGHLPGCICGSSAHWQKNNKRVGIFCDECRMMTGYWDTIEDALKCWIESPHKRKPTNEEMDKLIELMKKR